MRPAAADASPGLASARGAAVEGTATALPPAILLLGPTASGKSALAMQLARRWPIEIISVDSAQVYRGMDVGTAKPDAHERAQVPHHLIDLIEPTESFSAARFAQLARATIADVASRGRLPLLVGGTMLYARTLTQGIDALPSADAAVREAIEADARALGWPALHARLMEVDPVTAARLAPNDAQRIQRALEVHRITGRPMSSLLGAPEPRSAPGLSLPTIALEPSDRAVLHARIAERFDRMLACGLVGEVAALRARPGMHESLPSMRCVGYRQVWGLLEGRYDHARMREQGIAATRQLAKRQLTWLRSMPQRIAIDCLRTDAADTAARFIDTLISGPIRYAAGIR